MLKPYFVAGFVLVASCAEQTTLQIPHDFDPNQISNLLFHIEDSENNQLKSMTRLQLDGLDQEISSRFAEAGYPVLAASLERTRAGGSSEANHAYQLIASVSEPELTETPPGFTLDFGNADPRAPGYQKAWTVDIRCRLSDRTEGANEPALSERVTIPKNVAERSAKDKEHFDQVRDYYLENIGAACHDLLSELGIYPTLAKDPEPSAKTFGSIKIQTDYETDLKTNPAPALPPLAEPGLESEIPASSLSEPRAILHESGSVIAQPAASSTAEKLTTQAVEQTLPANAHAAETLAPNPESNSRSAGRNTGPIGENNAAKEIPVDQEAPTPVAMEQRNEATKPPLEESTSDPALNVKENETRDWRKKKITIFNRGDTVILKMGPDQSRY